MIQKIKKEDYPKIVQLYNKGKSLTQIGNKFNVTPVTIAKILKKQNVERRPSGSYRKYSLNQNLLDVIDTPEKAYFLGWAFSDGYNNEERGDFHLSLQESDKNVLEKLQFILESNQPLLFIKKPKKHHQNLLRLNIRSQNISEKLANMGCVQNKTKIVELPKILDNLMPYFLRGYFEGDGCLNFYFVKGKKTNYLNVQFFICSGSIKIIKQMMIFLKKILGIKIYFKIQSQTVFYMSVYGINNVTKIMDYLYQDNLHLVLDRKFNYYADLKIAHKQKLQEKINRKAKI